MYLLPAFEISGHPHEGSKQRATVLGLSDKHGAVSKNKMSIINRQCMCIRQPFKTSVPTVTYPN